MKYTIDRQMGLDTHMCTASLDGIETRILVLASKAATH